MKYELTHDILARKIAERATAEDKYLREVLQFVQQRHRFYDRQGELLGKEGLEYIQPHLRRLRLSTEELAFIRASQEARRLEEEAAQRRLQEEMERKQAMQKARIFRQRAYLAAAALVILSLAYIIWQEQQSNQKLTASIREAAIAQGDYYASQELYDSAVAVFRRVPDWEQDEELNNLIDSCLSLSDLREDFDGLMVRAGSALEAQSYVEARQELVSAKELNYAAGKDRLSNFEEILNLQVESALNRYRERVELLIEVRDYANAQSWYQRALELKPDDALTLDIGKKLQAISP